jgi:hypothetical protein
MLGIYREELLMTVIVSADTDAGGMTIPLFHCIFNEGGSVTHFMHEVDLEVYRSLPNMYAVCIADRSKRHKRVTGGFFVVTNYSHNDEENFTMALSNIVAAVPRLAALISEQSSFLPGRIVVPDGPPPTEEEMLRVMVSQALKHSSAGAA